jgi:hypothetical protein
VAWWKRYEPLLEAKPVSGDAAVRELVAKELVELFEGFPPEESAIVWEDAALERKLKGRLHELPRLDPQFVDVLAQIVTWDLAHENDALDHFLRNDRHRAACPTQAHVDGLMFLWRTVIEHLEARKEEAQGILKRADLPKIVEDARARFTRRFRERE